MTPGIPFLLAGSLLAGLAVLFGAFGAHALKRSLSASMFDVFQTAVQYQMTHALALILVGMLVQKFNGVLMNWAGGFILAGTLLFSGSLYVLSLSSIRWVGPVTPLGGLALIVGWLLMFIAILRY